jgi:hypothetical protein
MGTLIVWSIVFGMALGCFFKWPILVPACGLAMVLAVAHPAETLPGSLLQALAVNWTIQAGYLIGAAGACFFDDLYHGVGQRILSPLWSGARLSAQRKEAARK